MTLRELIVAEFQATVLGADLPSELKRSLKYSERVPGFIDRLVAELEVVPRLKAEQATSAVNTLTLLWCNCLKQRADELYMSDAEKQRIMAELATQAEDQKFADKLLGEDHVSTERSEKGETERSSVEV